MPRLGGHDIYSRAPLRGLLDEQMRALAPDLQRCFGQHALWLTASAADTPPTLPLLGHWTQLRAGTRQYHGDLSATHNEPLPFIDDAFELVLLRHVLEVVPAAAELLREATRVLSPGGLLVVTGVHRFSAWAPWFYWRSRGLQRKLWTPWQLSRLLRQGGLEIERVQRVGRPWPNSSPNDSRTTNRHSALSGGYVLIARKRRASLIPLRVNARTRGTLTGVQWSPGAQRSSLCWSPFSTRE